MLWGDGYELRAFEDRWKGGIDNYIAWMKPKLQECHRILKSSGTFYLHCDWHASHRLRVLLDEIFGTSNFANEIIWKRTTAHADTRGFGHVHDTIYRYTKTAKCTWNQIYRPYAQGYIDRYFKFKDEYFGERGAFWTGDITGAGLRNGETGQAWKGIDPGKIGKGRHWVRQPSELDRLDGDGRIYWPAKGGVPKMKRYLKELPGLPMDSIWDDIPSLGGLSASSGERLGYPTQKPEALLSRIIRASSNKGDLVLDPMCGCGTAVAAAHRLERRWVGIDVSPSACKLMARRLKALKEERVGIDGKRRVVKIGPTDVKVIGLPQSMTDLESLPPFEFQNWVCQKLHARVSTKKVGDLGIDGTLFDGSPLQVKQSEHVGRPVVDSFETALQRVKRKGGVIVAFSFTKGAFEEAARAKNELGLEIELKTVKQIVAEEGGNGRVDGEEE